MAGAAAGAGVRRRHAGAGGHTRALAQRVEPGGTVLAFDRDPAARAAAEINLAGMCVKLADANYRELPEVLQQLGILQIDGMVLDLGLSSDQLADAGRGFSFDADGPLDLRFNPDEGEPASELVNKLRPNGWPISCTNLAKSGSAGESPARSWKHAGRSRSNGLGNWPTWWQLVPRSREERTDRATRTFQALRIAVNDELGSLDQILKVLPDYLHLGFGWRSSVFIHWRIDESSRPFATIRDTPS